jgi:hypothetical protein
MASLLEAFPGRFPSEILREVLSQPVGWVDEVLEANAYRHAKAMVDAADTEDARRWLPRTPLFQLVREIDMDLAADAMERKRANG